MEKSVLLKSFDNLEPYDNENFLELMREVSSGIIEKNDENGYIYCLNELRRMRKYHPRLFSITFSNILSDFLNNLMYNKNENVVTASLIFTSELFSTLDYCLNTDWLRVLIINTIDRSTCKNECIKTEALVALYNLANNIDHP